MSQLIRLCVCVCMCVCAEAGSYSGIQAGAGWHSSYAAQASLQLTILHIKMGFLISPVVPEGQSQWERFLLALAFCHLCFQEACVPYDPHETLTSGILLLRSCGGL